jgi:hypothetical protein
MDGVEAPEDGGAVLEAVAPIDAEVAEEDGFDGLEPPGLGGDTGTEGFGTTPSSQ